MLFSNLGELFGVPFCGKTDCWESLDFRAGDIEGHILLGRPGTVLPKVTLDPKLTGWHKIYLGMLSPDRNKSYCTLRLSSDLSPSRFNVKDPAIGYWKSNEIIEENLWKCADMTGITMDFLKPMGEKNNYFALAWVRFEPMTEDEIAAMQADAARKDTKALHMHCDMDWMATNPQTVDEICRPIETMKDSDAELITLETYYLLSDYSAYDSIDPAFWDGRTAAHRRLQAQQGEIFPEYARRAHEAGIRLHAGQRMSLAHFVFPYDLLTVSNIPFVNDHPELWCVDRDGERLPIASYAYSETWDFVISEFLRLMEFGFDGVTLIMHRGIFLLFEKPVLEAFEKACPGVDIRELPLNDPRVLEVRCSFMTAFMRKLRAALPKEKTIHVVASFSLYDNLLVGMDLKTWMAEGLITSVAPSNMQLWEDVGASFNYDTYVRAKYESLKSPIRRFHYNHLEKMLCHSTEWLDAARPYGVKVYFELPWEGTVSPQEFRDYAHALYQRGAENISLWDCFVVRTEYLPEWNAVRELGHKARLFAPLPEPQKNRVLRLGGISLAAYHPSWRG